MSESQKKLRKVLIGKMVKQRKEVNFNQLNITNWKYMGL